MKKIKENEEFQLGLQVFTYSILEGKIVMKPVRKGKASKSDFIPPTLDQVKAFFKDEGYTEESAIKAFKHYNRANWHDSRGNKVKNWKQKMGNNWLKDENKIIIKETLTESKFLF